MAPHEAIHILDGVDVDVVARFVQGVRPPFILHVMRARVKGEYGGRRCKFESGASRIWLWDSRNEKSRFLRCNETYRYFCQKSHFMNTV